jgi:hypothetical protein
MSKQPSTVISRVPRRVIGEFAERQAASRNLLLAGSVAVIGIYFLLVTSFQNWRLATLTFFTLPWALVGGILAAYLTGGVLSLGSLVGLLTILGIATRNGIMMISHFEHLEKEEGEPFGVELVKRGARTDRADRDDGVDHRPTWCPGTRGDIPGQEIEYLMAIVILASDFDLAQPAGRTTSIPAIRKQIPRSLIRSSQRRP